MLKHCKVGILAVTVLALASVSCGTKADGEFCDILTRNGDEGIELATEQYSEDINLNRRFFNKGNGGITCLHVISQNDMPLAAAFLLERGADPNIADVRGTIPLHHSVRRGDLRVSRLFLEHGADPKRLNGKGETPISLAEASQNDKMLLLLSEDF